jgi:uncharacterized protein YejL (UPF0352 family)
MMTLSTTALKDLHKLANKRVEDALNSVVQLLESDDQVLHLSMTVLSNLATGAAEHMHQTVQRADGTHPPVAECYCRVLSMLAAVQGLDSKVVTEEEAKQAGLIA